MSPYNRPPASRINTGAPSRNTVAPLKIGRVPRGGTLELSTVKGEGSAFTLRLPTTLAILRALIADVGGERYALPITHVAETLDLQPTNITELNGRDGMLFRDSIIPLVHLRDVVGTNGEAPPRQPVIVLQIGERRSGLVVDALPAP